MSDLKIAPDGLEVARTLDAKGLSCPMPILKTKKEIKNVKSGEILEILGTDPGTRNDIPGWAEKEGHEWLGEKQDSGFLRFYVRKA